MNDLYERLAEFFDELPAGFPRTASGVELRILRKLFTPEEAELCMHLTLLGEEPRVIARRAKFPIEEVSRRLDEMEQKGLIFGIHRTGKPTLYLAQQFAIGFWEGQVNRLDRELVEAFEEYLPDFFNVENWRKVPQLRTIPIGESIEAPIETLPYERAEEIVRSHSEISVSNCICRQELGVLGKECGKPLETCMGFGIVARHVSYSGRGRSISQPEALEILRQADQAGLVLQPANSKEPLFICACCGCCCAVLRTLKLHPKPASLVSSPYIAQHDPETCAGCGNCVERCQMGAITLPNGTAVLDQERCIGCGLCVSTCATGAITLTRKPEGEQPLIPNNLTTTNIQLAQTRGKLGTLDLVSMVVKSKVDRLGARL